ncbi:MAG: DUF362 domain-containing protein [Muribaculaceae bacterium]|nr:DUF362 domain-containing protein [Muribaculaceae bacterium]
MKIISKLTFGLIGATIISACGHKQASAQTEEVANDSVPVAKVYYTKEITPESLVKIYEALGVEANGKVAVKISTGESAESYNLSPALIKDLVQKVNGTLVESNTAYHGNRNTTEAHLQAVAERGYLDVAPVDIMDAEADIKIPVNDTTWIHYDIVGSHLPNYDFMINLAHFKGHQMGGFGGVLKNASIGVASSAGKTYIHSAGRTEDVDHIWEYTDNQDGFIEAMASAAQGVHNYFKQPGKDIVYIDVMNNMSIDCDCNGHPKAPVLKDMGILASTDPVALDKAAIDMVFNHESVEGDDAQPFIERVKKMHGTHIIDHAEKIGLGTTNYTIVNID